MAKKTINSDIYNLSQLVDDVKKVFLPDESDETLAIGTYGYIGAIESHRLQTQVQMTGELSNEVFPSRARLERNVITHAIMANIEDINAIPSKMTAFLAIREEDLTDDCFDSSENFYIDRENPIYIGDFEFHLEYDIALKRIKGEKNNAYSAVYIIPEGRDVPTSTITSPYLSPPAVSIVDWKTYIYLTVTLSQVTHTSIYNKLVTSNIIDNKTMTFDFTDQLVYFEIRITESDDVKYMIPLFEGSSVPDDLASQYYCWYQYIDTNLIRVRFDRQSYMPGLNAEVECLIKTSKGANGNFTYTESIEIDMSSELYGYKGIIALVSPLTAAAGGKNRKSKEELQALIPKELLSRGSLTTITDLNNYFSTLDTEDGRVIIQKKIDNQIERVYYAYLVAKDFNYNILPSNTIDVKVGLEDLVKSTIAESQSDRYILKAGACIKLDEETGIGYINHDPIPETSQTFSPQSIARGKYVDITFNGIVTDNSYEAVSVSASINGKNTPTYCFPESSSKSVMYTSKDGDNQVEDFMQMGVGEKYTYEMEYSIRSNGSIINVTDSDLLCFDFIEGYYYTADDPDNVVYFGSLPISISGGLKENDKVYFGITRRLNASRNAVTTFVNGTTAKYELKAVNDVVDFDEITRALGIANFIESVEVSDPTIFEIKLVPGEETHQYTLKLLRNFDTKEWIKVHTSYGDHTIDVTQEFNTIKNEIIVSEYIGENEIITKKAYTCYTPTLLQDINPEKLEIGTVVKYTLRYRSSSNTFIPKVQLSFSRGIEYVPFTNHIKSEIDTEGYYHEPVEGSLRSDVGFLYTNPYTISINGYTLYSAFYMMAMRENPYIHFAKINTASAIQFIATNIGWNRPFLGETNDTYHMSITIAQSVQDDLGIVPRDEYGKIIGEPAIKCVAVFKRDGENYRYRSLDLTSFEYESEFTFTFEKDFFAKDKLDNDNNIRVENMQVVGQKEDGVCVLTSTCGEKFKDYNFNEKFEMNLSTYLDNLEIHTTNIQYVISSDESLIDVYQDENSVWKIAFYKEFSKTVTIHVADENEQNYYIDNKYGFEYGYFNPTTDIKLYVLVGLPDSTGTYSRFDFDSIKPEVKTELPGWTVTNIYDVVNGVTMYDNYSEIMGSRVVPYSIGDTVDKDENVYMELGGYTIKSVPVLGYDYCKDEDLVQDAIDALDYRKSYIDQALVVQENSFGIDFKLFNTYGPSKTFFIVKDEDANMYLDEDKVYIDRVNLTLNFRTKLVSSSDSYTKDNIIKEIKEYIEDLEDLDELHIPNLITQITTNYKEQIVYFEYLGFNNYGADVQHIYKDSSNEIGIHTAPEFLNVNNTFNDDGTLVPDINIYISDI